jgi:hypothetical protein
MKKGFTIGLAAMVAVGMLSIAPSALAKDGDIIREGNCSGATDWKLKLSPENGQVEVEFEVDQNVNGQDWRVTLKKNGTVFARAVRTTQAPSGSFEFRRVTANIAGQEWIQGRAVNLSSGEVCQGGAKVTF